MLRALVLVAAVAVLGTTASAKPTDDWLAALTDKVIADVTAGKPLVVEVHAPLCDSSIIACGNAKLGDGDNPDTNLYWSTTPGFGEWFARRGSGWKRVLKQSADATGDKDILAVHVYRRSITTPAAWRKRGAPKQFELDIVVHGWRGKAIDRALGAYARVSGKASELVLDDNTRSSGGAAQSSRSSGTTGSWTSTSSSGAAARREGHIAIACDTAPYMAQVPAATRVPLLMTSDLLFANAAPLEAAVLAFARGGGYAQIRKDATSAYADVQKETFKHVSGVFTNPSDKRW